ncbi:MAG: hypothetical protein JST22_13660 [Bacteroidetes bacterium]|nr:hypothetical protein [Bacteroidota bacterium]
MPRTLMILTNTMPSLGCITVVRSAAMLLLLCAGMAASAGSARGQLVPGAIALPDTIAGVRTLSADTAYQMVNTVRVVSGGLLTIPPGTLIYGNRQGLRSCLQVERGGLIYARGTAARPIVFTSPNPQTLRASGEWLGIILLGRAVINSPGGTATLPGGTGAVYGGNNDADSTGVLSYVRIEYAGGDLGGGLRSNGLTMAGVGNRTVIDAVQVSYSGEDSFEWFGGAVNAEHLISFACVDDDFQTNNGYRGRGQFFFGMRDSTLADPGISNGLEAYNDAAGTAATPLSRPVISNATLAGPFRSDTQATGFFGSGGMWTANTRYGLCNSVIVGWQEGIRLDGLGIAAIPPACPQPADLKLRTTAIGGQRPIWAANGVQGPAAFGWFNCAPAVNANPGNHPLVGLVAVTQSDIEHPDPRPIPGTPAAAGTDFTDPMLAGANNFAFMPTAYKGAFDPALARNRQWDTTWTDYRPNRTAYVMYHAGWNLVALANAPANASRDSVFAHAASSLFKFSNGYVVDSLLRDGIGYWLQLAQGGMVQQVGTAVTLPRTVNVVPGWNLVASGASVSAPAANVTVSGTILASGFFGYDNGYTVATAIEPGRAYWVKSLGTGTLTFNP